MEKRDEGQKGTALTVDSPGVGEAGALDAHAAVEGLEQAPGVLTVLERDVRDHNRWNAIG